MPEGVYPRRADGDTSDVDGAGRKGRIPRGVDRSVGTEPNQRAARIFGGACTGKLPPMRTRPCDVARVLTGPSNSVLAPVRELPISGFQGERLAVAGSRAASPERSLPPTFVNEPATRTLLSVARISLYDL